MGRETRILLALLGLLAGVFMGVVTTKLLTPRPPAGVGPDIQGAVAPAGEIALVPPPEFDPATAARPAEPLPTDAAAPAPPPESAAVATMLAAAEPAADISADRSGPISGGDVPPPDFPPEPAVVPASFEQTDLPALPPLAAPGGTLAPSAVPRSEPPVPAGDYVVAHGDSWWAVAERAYGDGRLYRALFAWNRGRDARVTLAPGTCLDIPPLTSLTAAWPGLVPRD